MSEIKKEERTYSQVENEYGQLCVRTGYLGCEIKRLDTEIDAIRLEIKDLKPESQELAQAYGKLGHRQYAINVHKKDLELIYDMLRDLNFEGAKLKEKEGK